MSNPYGTWPDAVGDRGARDEAMAVDAEGIDLVGGLLGDDQCVAVAIELHLGGTCAGRAQRARASRDGLEVATVVQPEAGDRITADVEHVNDIVVERHADGADTTGRLDVAETEAVCG